MKITEKQLRDIIKESLSEINRAKQYPWVARKMRQAAAQNETQPMSAQTNSQPVSQYRQIAEEELRNIIREALTNLTESENIEEGLFGLSLDNRVKNGHWREEIHTKNPVINTAWKYGWELKKPDENIEGEYDARVMSGQWNNVEMDRSIEGVSHPKASWPMLIAMLNKELRPQGYVVSGANYHTGKEDLMGNETHDGYGANFVKGTIIVRNAQ